MQCIRHFRIKFTAKIKIYIVIKFASIPEKCSSKDISFCSYHPLYILHLSFESITYHIDSVTVDAYCLATCCCLWCCLWWFGSAVCVSSTEIALHHYFLSGKCSFFFAFNAAMHSLWFYVPVCDCSYLLLLSFSLAPPCLSMPSLSLPLGLVLPITR